MTVGTDATGEGGASQRVADLSDDELERARARRFRARVERVLAVMQEERIDWRGVARVTSDGRIAVSVVPVEMGQP